MMRRLLTALVQWLRHPLRHWRMTLAFWLLVLTAAGGVALWKLVLHDRLVAKKWGVVKDQRIYRSGLLSIYMVRPMLQKHNIKVIVSLVNEEKRPEQLAEIQAAAELGIERIVLPLEGDGTGKLRNYARAIQAIVRADREGKCVLVHCVAGVSRTGGVIYMYRVLVEGWPPDKAYREMRKYRWNPKGNPELTAYINDNMAALAGMLVEMGVIPRVPDPLPKLVIP